jgi:hypothetical protein
MIGIDMDEGVDLAGVELEMNHHPAAIGAPMLTDPSAH